MLREEEPIPEERREIIWNALTLINLDPHTNQYELKVQTLFICKNLQINYQMFSLMYLISSNRNLIKYSKKTYTMSLIVFDFI